MKKGDYLRPKIEKRTFPTLLIRNCHKDGIYEERQAFDRIIKLYNNGLDLNKTTVVLTEDTRCLGILLNLIEKQEKIKNKLEKIQMLNLYIGSQVNLEDLGEF